jgi:hypothetical protein
VKREVVRDFPFLKLKKNRREARVLKLHYLLDSDSGRRAAQHKLAGVSDDFTGAKVPTNRILIAVKITDNPFNTSLLRQAAHLV